ncbi:MAG: hypothetical protein ABIZ72_06460 [Candidatus Limnocylindrales bacterium]
MADRFAAAQRIADAVLYEGYLLYPYRASSSKNRVRFQFGVVAPMAVSERDPSEYWSQQTELLVTADDPAADPRLTIRIRFLQLQGRAVEAVDASTATGFRPIDILMVGQDELIPWEEAVEGLVDIDDASLAELLAEGRDGRIIPFSIGGARDVEHVHGSTGGIDGRIVRTRWPIDGRIVLVATDMGDGLARLRVRVENLTADDAVAGPAATRDEGLRHSLLGCHTLLAIRAGAFVSQTDPPPEARDAAATCQNVKTWPVLAGEQGDTSLVLSSPIILSDHPAVAPESPQDLFDGAEIDEILTLRIMTLSDEEKRAARATDPRARAIIDAADAMPPEILDKLHGAIRYLRGGPAGTVVGGPNDGAPRADASLPATPSAMDSWATIAPDFPTFTTPADDAGPAVAADPLAGSLPAGVWEPEARVAPENMAIEVDGTTVTKGSSVRLRPNRRADAMDTFLVGRLATVEAIFESVDDEVFVAITVDDDPATELHREFGRFFYFSPDELEPVGANAGTDPASAAR